MKRSKFSEAQIAFVLKEAEGGMSIGEVCRKAGISDVPPVTRGKSGSDNFGRSGYRYGKACRVRDIRLHRSIVPSKP
jgi:hypothetical protein